MIKQQTHSKREKEGEVNWNKLKMRKRDYAEAVYSGENVLWIVKTDGLRSN